MARGATVGSGRIKVHYLVPVVCLLDFLLNLMRGIAYTMFSLISLLGVFFLIACVAYLHYATPKHDARLDWIGIHDRPRSYILPKLRARLQNTANFKQTLQRAYDQYACTGKACILPTISNDVVLLPPKDIDWLLSQSDSYLSASQPHIDNLQCDYTFPHPSIIRVPEHHHVIKTRMTRQLGSFAPNIVDEVAHASDLFWGHDTEAWKSVHVFGTMMQIVTRASNRTFVGLPLCRNTSWLANAAGFAREVSAQSFHLRQTPSPLRPLLAAYLLRKCKRHIADFTAQSSPEILRRRHILSAVGGDAKKADLSDDLLSWLVVQASTSTNPKERSVETIAGRLLAIQFASIHTSTFTATNLLFDLVSSPHGAEYLQAIRDEVNSVLSASNGQWTKSSIDKLHKIDSCLRESSRLSSFLGAGLVRTVLAPKGLTAAASGTYCPPGSHIGVLTHGIHNDERNYPKALTFRPFRHSDQRSATSSPYISTDSLVATHDVQSSFTTSPMVEIKIASSTPDGPIPDTYIKKANLAFVSTSSIYHPFGHGRHACPGRFFAALELKLLIAYLVTNYDFELLPVRPESRWRGTVLLPPMAESIRVRRRRTESVES